MKKIAKMSLVAAMAISGLTSASAVDLTEAIKGVKVSGFVEYRAEKTTNTYSNNDSEMQHDLDIRFQAVIPVNDNITATIRFDESSDEDKDSAVYGTYTAADVTAADTAKPGQTAVVLGENKKKTTLDSNSKKLDVDRAYFTYKNDGLAVNFGLMGDILTDGGQGDGITVSKNFGSVAVGAGYFYTTSSTNADEVAYVKVSGSIDPVSYYATYATVLDSDSNNNTNGTSDDNKANFLHLGVSGNIAMVSVALDYSSKTGLDGTAQDENQYKISLGTSLGMVDLGLEYAANDKDGGSTMIDGTDVAATEISIGDLELHQEGDASAFLVSVKANINAQNSVQLRYASSDNEAAKSDIDVIRVNYNYMMSKNFKLYAEYTVNDDEAETDKRTDYVLGAKYTF